MDRSLDPSFDGSCVVCGRFTETEVSADGDAEFPISFLVRIGLTHFEARSMIHGAVAHMKQDPDDDFVGEYRLCSDDALKASVRIGVALDDEELPIYRKDDFPPQVNA
jgi:hypothetical protein